MLQRIFLALLLVAAPAFAAGTVTETRATLYKYTDAGATRVGETVTLSWTADASAATVPNTSVVLRGYVAKAITNPGSTAPTDNYDIAFGDPADTALDALANALGDRDTSNTEQVYPTVSGATSPVYVNGTYLFKLTNNSVNSATGVVVLYLLDQR